MKLSEAPYALRVVRRRGGDAAILYRRHLTERHEEKLDRVSAIAPLAFTAGAGLLRAAVRTLGGNAATLAVGPYHPLDQDWGARVGCYAQVAAGLRNASRLHRAAEHLRHADGAEAAWWFGMMTNGRRQRVVRALRILVEAVA